MIRDARVMSDAAATDAGEPYIEVTLRRRQTLWDVARAYGVSLKDLRDANGLTPWEANRVRAGMVIRVPGVDAPIEEQNGDEDLDAGLDAGAEPLADDASVIADDPDAGPIGGAYHTVEDGETLWDIARTYDKTLDEMMRANGWDDDDARSLAAGQRVLVPGITERQIRTPRATQRADGMRGMRVRIGRGETVWDLARRYNVSVAEIMAANRLTPQAVQALTAGSELVMPGVWQARVNIAPPVRPPTPMQERALRMARRLGLGSRTAAQQLLHGRVQRRWVAAAGGRGNRLPGTLRWPVTNGRLSRGYGSGSGGYHRALDIVGDIGWNVRASAPGIVGYSGNELTGFGNVVLVVHPGGWVTLYGHNSVNFVVAGQRVRAGAVLAEVGSTGRSTGPHVHFELIYDGQNCDPAALLRPGVRHRARLARIERATWTEPRSKPEAVRCLVRMRHPSSDLPANE